MWWHLMRERLKWHLWRHLLQYVDFKTKASKEEIEFAKWEEYEALVLKMRQQVATHADFDIVEDMSSNGDAQPDEMMAVKSMVGLKRVPGCCCYIYYSTLILNNIPPQNYLKYALKVRNL